MRDIELAARLIEALVARAAAEAGKPATLVSVSIEPLGGGEAARVDARVTRKTRTLVFAQADAFDGSGARIGAAASVHTFA